MRLRPPDAGYEWSVVDKGQLVCGGSCRRPDFRREVTFVNEDPVILVLDPSGNQLFDVSVIFTSQGRCQMKAKEENCEPWQVRRMALEDILFRFV